MALLLRLRAAGEELPGSVGLISPWLDLSCSAPAVTANAQADTALAELGATLHTDCTRTPSTT